MSTTKANLLIVEDEESIRTTLSYLLTEIGYSVQSAPDGLIALREIRRSAPDILLSDLNMPRMSGFELLPLIRRYFPAVKVIVMSDTFSGTHVPSGVVADAFYEKGANLGRLLQIIATLTSSDQARACPAEQVL